MNEQPQRETFFGACPHDCPDTCAMVYEVQDGKLVEVRGNKDHPMTRGTLCVKLKDFHDHHANPDRLKYPLRRTGPKGSRQFERISWDEAIAEIGRRWREIIATYGSQAIMPYSYLGNMGLVQGINSGDPFFNRLGTTVNEKTFCASGSSTAWLLTVGPTGGVDPESFVHSKFIVIWACNSISTNLHHWPFVLEAQKRGAKVVVIDSYRSRTAKAGDWHICPRPGTDGAFAMGIINSIIAQGLVDRDYVEHTYGFEELKARAAEFTPDYVERITGVKAADIRTFAKEFATTQPSVIRLGVALERHAGGGQAIRAVCALPALVGSWKHVGGGLLQMPLWDFPVDWMKVSRGDWIKPGTRAINNLKLGAVLTGEMQLDPPLKSLFVFCTNPVSQAPETNKIVAGLQREDLFTVVAEHFLTDTAKYADIVLPAAMAGEAEDMMWSWGHFYFTYNQKAVDPPGECKPTSDMWRMLAKEMGFDDPVFKMTDSELAAHYINWADPEDGRHRHGALQDARLLQDRRRRGGHARAAQGWQVPDSLRQGRVPAARCQELRRRPVPGHVRGGPGRLGGRSAAGIRAEPRGAGDQPGARQALRAQHHLAEEPRLFELVLRQREAQDQRPGRAVRADLARRRRQAEHSRRRSRAGL